MNLDFSGKTAIVTGGGSGIGEAIAKDLASSGANVVVADLDEADARRVAEAIKISGGKAAVFVANVSKDADVKAMVDFAVATFGSLDLAVNNAGIGGVAKRVGDYSLEEWRQVTSVNLDGVFLGMKYELQVMKSGSAIVNMASILGEVGFASSSAYVASKHGVVGLTQTAALEYATDGIRVNAIGPGFINTPLLSENLSKEQLVGIAAMHPMKHLGTSEDVSALTLFLLSDRAGFITGSYHLVDGGYTAQ
jgi:NAD(P)-dependent dehydrogenase (short-subunit alcohol dehydrogenase family)